MNSNFYYCSYVNSLEAEKRKKAYAIIEEMEDEANRNIKLQPGIVEMLSFLAENKVSSIIIVCHASYRL